MTKKENVLEKCRINLDKEKVLHSITRGEKEELQQRIDKAIEYIENDKKDKCMEDFKTGIMTRELKILEILKGDDKE